MSLERILVIESDEKIRDLLNRFLSGKGFDVLAVAEAADAAEQFDEYAPDLALVNAVVDGGSGSDVCIDLLDRRPQLHIIVMGTARQEKKFDRDARMALGVDNFLMKPFSASKLIDMLDRIEMETVEADVPEDDPLPAPPPVLGPEPGFDAEDGFDDLPVPPLLAPPTRASPTSSIPKEVAPPTMESILSGSLGGSVAPGVITPPTSSFGPRASTQVLLEESELFAPAPPTSADALAGEAWDRASLEADAARHGRAPDREEEGRYALKPMSASGPTDPRGIYDEITLPQLLYNIFRDTFSGRLVLQRGAVRKDVFIVNGRPINADSNIRSESLGYLLINEAVITEDQHRQSVTVMRDRGLRQGEALVALGIIDKATVEAQLRRQVRERILNCFGWTGAEYGLLYDPNVSDAVETFQLNPLVLIFDGIKTSFPVAPLVNHFDAFSRRPIRSTAKLSDYATMLKPFKNELRVALLCDGQMTVGELLSASPYGLVDTLRILRALEIIKCVEFEPARAAPTVEASASPAPRARRRTRGMESRAPEAGARPSTSPVASSGTPPGTSEPRPASTRATRASTGRPASTRPATIAPEPAAPASSVDHATLQQIIGRHAMLENANHYEMFQVATDASVDQITDHYNKLNVAFRHYVGTVRDTVLSGKARQVRERLVTAFDVLRDPQKRKTYDALTLPVPSVVKAPDIIGGELNYERGRICIDASNFQKALGYLDHAVRQDAHQASYRMYRGYARFMTIDESDRRARVEAHDEIKNALSDDGNNDGGYVLLGHCYKETGNHDQALKAYKKALSINRSNSVAQREVARLDKDKPAEDAAGTGIFGKLFGR